MVNRVHFRTLLIIILVGTVFTTIFYSYNINVLSRKMNADDTSVREESNSWMSKLQSFFKEWKRPSRPRPAQDHGDRILEQLALIPPNLNKTTNGGTKLKTILLYNESSLFISPTYLGQKTFLEDNCLVKTCRITNKVSEFQNADAVVFTLRSSLPKEERPNPKQIWALQIIEPPHHTPHFYRKVFNWTMSYRSDSDVPNPYGKFFLYNQSVTFKQQNINYADNKTKQIAWFVSNCKAVNKRKEYVIELSKYIMVDVYGPCIRYNNLFCPRSATKQCLDMLKRDYKFYLAFENSNCKDYITEKFFYTALGNNVIPVVMGARKEDYEAAAPYHSFIHVDDFESPKALADYLHKLDKNDTLYNEYFQWKGTGEFSLHLNARVWCRFCAMLHADIPEKTYDDVDIWWRDKGICTPETWRNTSILR